MLNITRVMVADDQLLVRAGIASLLSEMDGFCCTAAFANGHDTIQACRQEPPDILLLDMHMPETDGLEVAREVSHLHPEIKVLFLSASTDGELARKALRAGAKGYVSKDFVVGELAIALRVVQANQMYLSPSVTTAMMHASNVNDATALTPRQCDVLRGIARGHSNKQMARDMGVSLKTVAYHRAELIQRLDLHDVASLTRYAMKIGLLNEKDRATA